MQPARGHMHLRVQRPVVARNRPRRKRALVVMELVPGRLPPGPVVQLQRVPYPHGRRRLHVALQHRRAVLHPIRPTLLARLVIMPTVQRQEHSQRAHARPAMLVLLLR